MNQLMNRKTMNPVEEAKRGYLGIQEPAWMKSPQRPSECQEVYVYKILEEGAAAQFDLRKRTSSPGGRTERPEHDDLQHFACYEMGEQIDSTVQSQRTEQKDGHHAEGRPGEYGTQAQ